jgi:hypothetical protein
VRSGLHSLGLDGDLSARLNDIRRFYDLMGFLEKHNGGMRTLAKANGKMPWPNRGIYFFFEREEERKESGDGPRVVRVGTHAIQPGNHSTLWARLRTHRGTMVGAYANGGNHRASVFRAHVGLALSARDHWGADVAGGWSKGNAAPAGIRKKEYPLERAVSARIRSIPFLVLGVDRQPSDWAVRTYLEANCIALLSNLLWRACPIDSPGPHWLGQFSPNVGIRGSGLWNVQHVDKRYDSGFLEVLASYIS